MVRRKEDKIRDFGTGVVHPLNVVQKADPIQKLDQTSIISYLDPLSQEKLHQIEILDSIPSTNDYLIDKSVLFRSKTVACFAEEQTAGKGRQGRRWVSPYGRNIYLSLMWNFHTDMNYLKGLSLVIAVAVTNALKKYGIQEGIGIKWPNDILWNRKKISGILIELLNDGEMREQACAVIGVGLNVDMEGTVDAVGAMDTKNTVTWTDVKSITQQIPNRNQLAGLLLNEMIQSLTQFEQHGMYPFMNTWRNLDLTYGQSIKLVSSKHEIQGIGKGIDGDGQLLLEVRPGQIVSFSVGEISLKWVT